MPSDQGMGPYCRNCAPNNSSEYSALLESLGRMVNSVPPVDSTVVLGTSTLTWRLVTGRNGLPDFSVLILDCPINSLNA